MKFKHPTFEAIIEKRYKRFLADIHLDNELIVAHVPNTGSMQSCWEKGQKVLISHNDDPKRKLKYTLEMTHNGKSWINVNTSTTNHLVKEALENDVIKELVGYKTIQPEKKILDSRIDFFLEGHDSLPDAYVEVKNVTLKLDEVAQFPDAVSTRGQKHLKDLVKIKEQGLRAVMLYVVNREDVSVFKSAESIDPVYSALLKEAHQKGVEVLCYQTKLTQSDVSISKKLEARI